MKKIFAICAFAFALSTLSAQHTTPRTGTGANNDNTYRAMTFGYKAVTDAVGLDTVKLNVNNYFTQVKIASLVDSVAFNFTPVTNCYLGDRVEITVTNSSGGTAVKWAGSNVATATTTTGGAVGTLYLAASKRANITFVFDGVKWVEVSRMAQQ